MDPPYSNTMNKREDRPQMPEAEPHHKRIKTLPQDGDPAQKPYSSALGAGAGAGAGPGPGPGLGQGVNLHKTKICARFEAGTCTFDSRCNFAHGVQELRQGQAQAQGQGQGQAQPRPLSLKTRPCKFFLAGNCPYNERCNFLHQQHPHPQQQQQQHQPPTSLSRPANWKTKLCINWQNSGSCTFAHKCHFAHGSSELQSFGGGASYRENGVVIPAVTNSSYNFPTGGASQTIANVSAPVNYVSQLQTPTFGLVPPTTVGYQNTMPYPQENVYNPSSQNIPYATSYNPGNGYGSVSKSSDQVANQIPINNRMNSQSSQHDSSLGSTQNNASWKGPDGTLGPSNKMYVQANQQAAENAPFYPVNHGNNFYLPPSSLQNPVGLDYQNSNIPQLYGQTTEQNTPLAYQQYFADSNYERRPDSSIVSNHL